MPAGSSAAACWPSARRTAAAGGENYVEVGTRLPYARFLALGTRHMPARDPIGVPSPARVERWFDLVAAELLNN